MHRLPTKSAIWRLRFASLLIWLCCLSFPLVIAAFAYAVLLRSREMVDIAIISLVGFVFLAIFQWIISLQTKCPLCMMPVLSSRTCSKNRKAKKLLGSYRLHVAGSILTRNYYRCPYCGEPTELAVRARGARR